MPSSTTCSWQESVAWLNCSQGDTYVLQDPCIAAVWPGHPTPLGSVARLAASPDMARVIFWPSASLERPCSRSLSRYGLARYHRSLGQVRSRHRRYPLGCTMQRARAMGCMWSAPQRINGTLHNVPCHTPAILRYDEPRTALTDQPSMRIATKGAGDVDHFVGLAARRRCHRPKTASCTKDPQRGMRQRWKKLVVMYKRASRNGILRARSGVKLHVLCTTHVGRSLGSRGGR